MLVTLSSAFRRRTLYYFSNLIGPCVLIARWKQMWLLVIELSSIFSTPIWMLVILAWLSLVSIFLPTLEKRYLVKDFIQECKTWSQSTNVLIFNIHFQVTLEITVLMSLTFFMNMVWSKKIYKSLKPNRALPGERHATSEQWNTSDRHLLLLHHDHGRLPCISRWGASLLLKCKKQPFPPEYRWRAAWFAQSWSWTTTTGSPTLTQCQSGSRSYFFRWSTLLQNKSEWQFVIMYKVSIPLSTIPLTLPLSGCPGSSECPDLDDRSPRSPSSCK